MSLVYMQAVHGWLSAYERLVNSQKFFSPYLTQEDLSRLGRNYIEVGHLTEEFFPEHDIRLVAVSDNIDTAEGDNELTPIRNLFNEWYARDISKKRRISNKIKGNAGEPMGQPPYGYMKDPDSPKHWIVDDEAAQVVNGSFRNCSTIHAIISSLGSVPCLQSGFTTFALLATSALMYNAFSRSSGMSSSSFMSSVFSISRSSIVLSS